MHRINSGPQVGAWLCALPRLGMTLPSRAQHAGLTPYHLNEPQECQHLPHTQCSLALGCSTAGAGCSTAPSCHPLVPPAWWLGQPYCVARHAWRVQTLEPRVGCQNSDETSWQATTSVAYLSHKLADNNDHHLQGACRPAIHPDPSNPAAPLPARRTSGAACSQSIKL